MDCKICKWIGVAIAVLVAVFAFWETDYNMWILLVLAVILIIVSFLNNCSCAVAPGTAPVVKPGMKK